MHNENPYLLIAGDLVPTYKNEQCFIESDISELMGIRITELWNNAMYRIFNLETPITDSKEKYEKAGEFLGAKKETINGIKALDPSLVCLANNHILDFGIKGVEDTICLLDKSNIKHIGFGKDIHKMKGSHSFVCDGKKTTIYNCCEHEFTYAEENKSGTNPFNPLTTLFEIQELKKECDFLIVIYHGGKELYQYCTPNLQKICHSIVKAGANLVVCQHSHCIGCFESYDNSTIIYGQGNFIFDCDGDDLWNRLTKEGLLIKVDLSSFSIEYVKYQKKDKSIELVEDLENRDFYSRSLQIREKGFVERKYLKTIERTSFKYFRQILSTKYLGYFDKKILRAFFMKKRYKKIRLLLINYFECEVHYENIITYLKENKELHS